MMIKFIFLDLDDTLLDFHRSEAEAIRKTLAAVSGEIPSDDVIQRYSEINDAQWKRLERGELTIPEVRLVRFEILFDELGWSVDPVTAHETYERFLCDGHHMMDGAFAMLERLYGLYPLYIASNGTPYMQKKRIADAGIAHFFKDIFISGELGAVKPQKAFFDACFARAPQLDPKEGIIFGDSLTSDIRGGQVAGMRTCWFNPSKKAGRDDIIPDFEIETHEAFFAVLDALSE